MTTDNASPIDVDLQRLYFTAEVAGLLEVSKDTVVRMAANGQLPFSRTLGSAKKPGIRRFRGRDILAVWLEMNQYL